MTELQGWEKVIKEEEDRNLWRGQVTQSLKDIEKALRVLCFLMAAACLFFAGWNGFHSKWILDHTEGHACAGHTTTGLSHNDVMALSME